MACSPRLLLPLCILTLAGCQHAATAPAMPAAPPPSAPAAVTPAPAAPASPAALPPVIASNYGATPPPSASQETQYVFGWGSLPANIARPRGGTSVGGTVTLAPGRALPLPEIAAAKDTFAKDRAAILALAGDYRTSFHFVESLGLAPDYKPTRPYHSWATEHVRVIEDTGRFISLQHTLVMFFKNPDGTDSPPMLQKHWRQDWTYEDTDLHTFRGDGTFARRRPTAAEAAGAWSQAVFQVDDSPRYEALGRWEHKGNVSSWTGERAWRPLPRREHTTRSDYDVMEGSHRIVLTPTGWLHEQNNWKRVAGDNSPEPRYVGHEIGLDRYERIASPSLAAADENWRKVAPYWAVVRRVWRDIYAQRERFTLRSKVGDEELFMHHFAHAEKLESGQPFDPVAAEREVRATLDRYLAP